MALMTRAPDLLIVQGDTSSALGAALAGFMADVAVAHVEAGLRTHDSRQPWPEEEYRTAIDAQADLLFAPTEHAAGNLARERVRGSIHVTGNTGIDALLGTLTKLGPVSPKHCSRLRLLVTCHRRESWGDGLSEIASALIALAQEEGTQIEMILHPNPHVSKRMSQLLCDVPNIALSHPCDHAELIDRMRNADLILSDSGGIQEEAPTLGVPLLVLREKTERPEGLVTGNMRLVGTSAENILRETSSLLSDPILRARMARPAFPYGDGRAAPRIAALIKKWLGQAQESGIRLNSAHLRP